MKGKSNGHRRALVESTGDRDVPVVRFCNPQEGLQHDVLVAVVPFLFTLQEELERCTFGGVRIQVGFGVGPVDGAFTRRQFSHCSPQRLHAP